MVLLLIDENLDQRILRGIIFRIPIIDYCVAQKIELQGSKDPVLLEWAARNQRILVTHDVNTIPGYAYDRVRAELRMPGVIIIPEDLAIGIAIEDLITLLECSNANEFENRILYFPL